MSILGDGLWFLAVIVWFMIAISIFSSILSAVRKKRYGVRSSDGHNVPIEQDLTCETKHGHIHQTEGIEPAKRYIVHEDPEEGYVILNGIRRKITDCKDL